jgi:hypothetical protein
MKTYLKGFTSVAFALLIVFILGGVIAQADDRPRLRVVHAATGISNVDIYVDDTLFFRNIHYRYISDYVSVEAKEHTIKVRSAGASPRDPTLFEVGGINYERNRDYTIIAAGKLEDDKYWRLDDDNNLPGTGTARVKVVHASFDAPTTEFCLADVCRTLAFQESTEYILLDPGIYMPQVRLNATGATYIHVPPLQLQDNSVYSVFMTGLVLGEPGLQLLYAIDSGEASMYPPPPPDSGHPPGSAPPPAYPPVTGAFLSPKLLGMLTGSILILGGGLGIWIIQRRQRSTQS